VESFEIKSFRVERLRDAAGLTILGQTLKCQVCRRRDFPSVERGGEFLESESKRLLEGRRLSGENLNAPGAIRTHGPRIRNPVLYPPELRGHT
jgi:hypothetical protein